MPTYLGTHLPTCPPSSVGRVACMGGPVEGCKCNCRVQGACSDAGADPGTFRHTILGIETKPSSRSITLQTPKDPAAVAVISTPTLARSLTCFAWLFSQAVRLESFLRILGQLWLSRASCFQIHRCQKPMHET